MADRAAVLVRTLPAPWGPVHVAASDRGVVAVSLFGPREALEADLARTFDVGGSSRAGDLDRSPAGRHLDRLAERFAAYLATGDATFDVPLDLHVRSAWDRLVLDGVRSIPAGSVATYGEVAAHIGRRGAARAVGGAVGRNPMGLLIPCHRVVAAGGRIGGYGGDWYGSHAERLAVKRRLLRLEGVVLPDDPGEPTDIATFG